MRSGNIPERESELAKITYTLFVQSMDTHYSEILKFLAILIPSLTAFFYVLNQYESAEFDSKLFMGFFFVTLIVMFIQAWGAIYALAMGYRFRYLQATVSRIEQAFGVDYYMPASFKIKRITGIRQRLLLSIAPAILQVHVFFFILSIVVIGVASFMVIPYPYKAVVAVVGPVAILFVFLMGAFYYPNKLNFILIDSDQTRNEDGSEASPTQKSG